MTQSEKVKRKVTVDEALRRIPGSKGVPGTQGEIGPPGPLGMPGVQGATVS